MWSTSGLVSISYSFSSANGNPIPSWGSIDSINNILIFTPPYITQDTNYVFTIESFAQGDIKSYSSSVFVQVDYWRASNCKVCKLGDTTKWSECSSGYKIYSSDSSWIEASVSSGAKAVSTTAQTSSVVSMGASSANSLLNLASPQGMWVTINQIQLIFILFLTGAYFPEDIQYYLSGIQKW